jgi:hypothetical protein
MDNILILLIVMSLTPVILLFVIYGMFIRIKKLTNEVSELNSKISQQNQKQKSLLKFYIGSKALLNDYSLMYGNKTDKKIEFTVDYEVEVVDISETEIKVKALNFVGNDSFSRDPQNRQSIISFLQDKWISKNEAQLILDESYSRQSKLEELGL